MPLSMDVHEITGGVAMDRVALAQACLEVPGHDVTGNRACFPPTPASSTRRLLLTRNPT